MLLIYILKLNIASGDAGPVCFAPWTFDGPTVLRVNNNSSTFLAPWQWRLLGHLAHSSQHSLLLQLWNQGLFLIQVFHFALPLPLSLRFSLHSCIPAYFFTAISLLRFCSPCKLQPFLLTEHHSIDLFMLLLFLFSYFQFFLYYLDQQGLTVHLGWV